MRPAILLFIVCILSLVACNNQPKPAENIASDSSTATTKIVAPALIINIDSLLSATGVEVLTILKNKQYDSLVKYISDSIHFSPYGYIGSGEQTLTAKNFTGLLASGKTVKWGNYDGSGDPINLTAKQYLQKFVYNADFLGAEKVTTDSFVAKGNTLNNLKEVYKNHRFIEYYFSGFDKKFAGMDWTCLRLVFKEVDNKYYLVAFVHDQWTV